MLLHDLSVHKHVVLVVVRLIISIKLHMNIAGICLTHDYSYIGSQHSEYILSNRVQYDGSWCDVIKLK